MQKILITCEHGGNQIPKEFGSYFADHQALLQTHRGWDPGALELYHKFVKAGADAAFYSEISRLLIELNRSSNHSNLYSIATKDLGLKEKESILKNHYKPYRQQVEDSIRTFTAQNHSVLHLSVHSFTPELNGETRNADIGLLFDPQRPREKEFCTRWKQNLGEFAPEIKVRFNYPYRGTADGFTTYLRKKFPDNQYAGIELEVNQKFPLGDLEKWERLQKVIVESFRKST